MFVVTLVTLVTWSSPSSSSREADDRCHVDKLGDSIVTFHRQPGSWPWSFHFRTVIVRCGYFLFLWLLPIVLIRRIGKSSGLQLHQGHESLVLVLSYEETVVRFFISYIFPPSRWGLLSFSSCPNRTKPVFCCFNYISPRSVLCAPLPRRDRSRGGPYLVGRFFLSSFFPVRWSLLLR